MNKERIKQITKRFDVEIEYGSEKPGIFDKNTRSFFTFEEILGDIFPSEPPNNTKIVKK